ncbi:MFS transporter [Novosphingobium sp.]|uniref:MFS transporter n=1 Tax=Novosphingobium sp. TaxID=1874826 RepID=UPI00262E1D04|nr:MFS transporter [Novosphingobium sp.]
MNFAALTIYGFGHFGKSLLWLSSVLIFAFYLTEVAGFAPERMGWVLALSMVVNAACDWLIGRGLGRHVTTVRSATRLQLAGSVIAGTCFVAFAQTAAINADWRTAYAIATLVLFRMGYSLYDVPQNTMMGLVVGNDGDRSQIAAARYAAAGLANIVVTLCLSVWLVQIEGPYRETAFAAVSVVYAGLAIGSALLVTRHFSQTPTRAEPARAPAPADDAIQPARESVHLPPVLAFGSILIYSTLMPVFTELKAYFAAFAFAPGAGATAFLLSSALGQVLAQPLWARVGRRRALVSLYRLAALAVIGAGASFALLGMAGVPWVLMAAFVFGAASSGLLMAIWSIMGHVAGLDPGRAMARFGQFTSCSKLAQAAAIMMIGQILALSDYRTGTLDLIVAVMAGAAVLTGTLCFVFSLQTRGRTIPIQPG